MRISAHSRLTRMQKTSAVGLAAAAGAVALSAGISPGSATGGDQSPAKPAVSQASHSAPAGAKPASAPTGDHATGKEQATVQVLGTKDKAKQEPSAAAKDRQAQAEDERKTEAENNSKAAQERKAEAARADKDAARSAERPSYPDNVDGWIKEARSIMKQEGIPGSHEGIKKNIIRESGGDPGAVNDWDINAKKGTPSKGLLQVIQPTFDQYHVQGTKDELTDPVANIVAACNYAADRYGSMDNVNSAY